MNIGDKFQNHVRCIVEYYNLHGATLEQIKTALESEIKEIEQNMGGKKDYDTRNGYRRVLLRNL